ncbi:MAG: hypothetical protein AAF438_10470, partial [Pseudomonadota bacterium]
GEISSFENGQLITLGEDDPDLINVAGDYGLYVNGSDLIRRQFSTSSEVTVSSDYRVQAQVFDDGTVVYLTSDGFFFFSAGVTTQLTQDGVHTGATLPNGIEFAYQKAQTQIGVFSGDQITILGEAVPGRSTRATLIESEGWLAYGQLGNLGQTRIETRAPDGTVTPRTFLGRDVMTQDIAPNGEMMIGDDFLRKFHVANDNTLTDITFSAAPSFYVDGKWQIAMGRSLFDVDIVDPVEPTSSLFVGVGRPFVSGPNSDEIEVIGNIISTAEIESVIATVADRSVELFYIGGRFVGTLSLNGLGDGTYVIQVVATDVLGRISQSTSDAFEYNARPILTLSEPIERDVARPNIRVVASCTDAGASDPAIIVSAGGDILTTLVGTSVDQVFDLSALLGTETNVSVTCDDGFHTLSKTRKVFVDTSPAYLVADTVPGEIVDFDDSRILFLTGESEEALHLFDRTTGTTTEVFSVQNSQSYSAYNARLIPQGVLFTVRPDGTFQQILYEWRGGVLEELDLASRNPFLRAVEGDFALVTFGDSTGVTTWRRQLSTQQNIQIGDDDTRGWALAPDGSGKVVVEFSDNRLYAFENGTLTQLNDSTNTEPGSGETDGTNYYYTIYPNLIVNDGVQEQTIARATGIYLPRISTDAGRASFTRLDAGGVFQTWIRDAVGNENIISFFGSDSSVGPTSDSNEVVFRNSSRYFYGTPTTVLDIGAALGWIRWSNGTFNLVMGTHLFTIDIGQGQPPGGVSNIEAELTGADPDEVTIVDDELNLTLTVDSNLRLETVTAQIGGLQVDFDPTICYGRDSQFRCLQVDVDLTSLTGGTYTLVVTLTDLLGESIEFQRDILIDRAPVVTVASPVATLLTSVPQTITLDATCIDDLTQDPIFEYQINDGPWLAFTPGIQLDVTDTAIIRYRCADEIDQTDLQVRTVSVLMNNELVEVFDAPGTIFDIVDDRAFIRFQNPDGSFSVAVYNGTTDSIEVEYPIPEGRNLERGVVTPSGAHFVTRVGQHGQDRRYFEWINGVLNEDSPILLEVKGDFSIWVEGQDLFRRQYSTGEVLQIAANAGRPSVADNGNVVWATTDTPFEEIAVFQNGVTTIVTAQDGARNLGPLTNGTDLLYAQTPAVVGTFYALILNQNDQEIIVSPTSTEQRNRSPVADYQLAGDWIAYREPGTTGQSQVWLRDPSGGATQLTFFGDSSFIVAVGENGEVMVSNGQNSIKDRYLYNGGAGLVRFTTDSGTVFWRNGDWFVVIGDKVLRYVPQSP